MGSGSGGASNRVLSQTVTTLPGGITTTSQVDAAGQLVRYQDELGGVTTYTYNSAGISKPFTSSTPPSQYPENHTAYQYDALGRQRKPLFITIRSPIDAPENIVTAVDYFLPGQGDSLNPNLSSAKTCEWQPSTQWRHHGHCHRLSRHPLVTLHPLPNDPGNSQPQQQDVTTYTFDPALLTAVVTVASRSVSAPATKNSPNASRQRHTAGQNRRCR